MGANFYQEGAHNKICDRTGFKIKSTEARKSWDHKIVRKQSWEARNPLDKIYSILEEQSVPDPRPEGEDVFVTTGEITADDL